MRLLFLLSLFCLSALMAENADKIPTNRQNLIRNSDIEELTSQGLPVGWTHDITGDDSLLQFAVESLGGSKVLTARISDEDTTELYGYWCQVVKLPGPGIYKLCFDIRTEDMSFAYWLSNNTGSVTFLKVFLASSGELSRSILEKFVDRKNIRTFSGEKWQTISAEFDFSNLETGSEIAVRIGAMAASAGWFAIDNIVFFQEK